MENKRKQYEDLKTHDRIHEHLSNKSDVISEEDIENAKTVSFDEELPVPNSSPANTETQPGEANEAEEKEGEADTGMVTPWNILGA